MNRLLCNIIMSLFIALNAMAQDSIPNMHRWIPLTAVGVTSVTIGTTSRSSTASWNTVSSDDDNNFAIVDAMQYTPMMLPWIMKAIGEPTRSGWGRMTTSHAIGGALMVGSVSLIKEHKKALRPDGSDYRSFPSGHSAWAFMGATMVANELGWCSPWYTFGAYSVATGVAMQRVMSHRHLPSDVIAGAGIGILATQIGYYIGDFIFGNRQYENKPTGVISTFTNEPSFSLETGAYFPFGTINAGGIKICRGMALDAGIKSATPISEHWSVGIELALRSMPIWSDNDVERTYISTLNTIGIVIAPSYIRSLNKYFAITAETEAGYYHKIGFEIEDKSISAGNGFAVGRIGAGIELRLDENLSMQAGIGYEISRYKFNIDKPSELYNTSYADKTSGITGGLLLNLATRVAF